MTYLAPHFPQFAFVSTTLRLRDGNSDLLTRKIALLRDCLALAQQRWPFDIDTACVLPSELLMLCRLPLGEGMGQRIGLIRAAFARHSGAGVCANIWDRDTEERLVAPSAVASRRKFILTAPTRARLVIEPQDWAYCSLHNRGAPQPARRLPVAAVA